MTCRLILNVRDTIPAFTMNKENKVDRNLLFPCIYQWATTFYSKPQSYTYIRNLQKYCLHSWSCSKMTLYRMSPNHGRCCLSNGPSRRGQSIHQCGRPCSIPLQCWKTNHSIKYPSLMKYFNSWGLCACHLLGTVFIEDQSYLRVVERWVNRNLWTFKNRKFETNYRIIFRKSVCIRSYRSWWFNLCISKKYPYFPISCILEPNKHPSVREQKRNTFVLFFRY